MCPVDEVHQVQAPRGIARLIAAQASHAEDLPRLGLGDLEDDECPERLPSYSSQFRLGRAA
jgi:hypothetical protein